MNDYFTMQDEFRIEGYWRLPTWAENREVRGSAAYSPRDGIMLTVEGALEDAIKLQGGLVIGGGVPNVSYDTVHGRTLNNEPVTLFEVFGGGLPYIRGLSGSQRQYPAQWLILGERVAGLEDWRHTSISARYHNLEEFVGRLPLSVPINHEGMSKLSAIFETPESLKGMLGPFEVSTEHRGLLSIDSPFVRAEISHTAWLRLIAPSAKGTDLLRGPLHMLGCLLDLAAGHHLPLIALHGRRGAHESQIFFKQRYASLPPKRIKSVGGHPIGFAFTLGGLGPNLTRHLGCWHEGMTKYSSAFNMYFALDPDADSDVAIDFHFLSYVTALESFHAAAHRYCAKCLDVRKQREVWRGSVMAVLGEIKEPAPVHWVRNILGSSLGPGLKARHEELYDEQPASVKQLLGARTEFIDYVQSARNRLAHGERPYESGEELLRLWRTTRKLRLMMQVMLLKQLELPVPLFDLALTNLSDFRFLH